MKIFSGFQRGVNLGGWFSQCDHSEERYNFFITQADFAVIKSWGCDHVRLPIDYDLLETADGTPKEQGYIRLGRAVSWARENGLHMVLDLHKTAGFSFDPDEHEGGFFENEAFQERFYRLWTRIARRFADSTDLLAFELLNEVTEQSYMDAWNRISQECIRRIRAISPTVPILVGGYWHNSAVSVPAIAPPMDENIVYNFHCYEPLIFTHQGATWMPPMTPDFRIPVTASYGEMIAASQRKLNGNCSHLEDFSPSDKLSSDYFTAFFAEALRVAEERNVPLYCGEYGVIDRVPPEQALQWYQVIHPVFEAHGIGRAAWSYREMDFGLSDARMDSVRQQLTESL
ncbi:MAG: cellulase family glycosylhydrolase [Oscillospiraceae bacterium]|nr:cellulase family glycosylhydrolase [Oscillospiraceae bacterium]